MHLAQAAQAALRGHRPYDRASARPGPIRIQRVTGGPAQACARAARVRPDRTRLHHLVRAVTIQRGVIRSGGSDASDAPLDVTACGDGPGPAGPGSRCGSDRPPPPPPPARPSPLSPPHPPGRQYSRDQRMGAWRRCRHGPLRARRPRGRGGSLPGVAGPYTWWSFRGQAFDTDAGWRIDYHLATPALATAADKYKVHRAASYDTRWTDHSPVVVEYTL